MPSSMYFLVASCEYELALGVNVDLSNAERNSLLDHIVRNASAAVKYERHVANFCLDLSKRIEGKTGPVCGILAVDITDTSSQHCNAQVSNHLALLRISALAHTDYAVFLAADRTDLSLEGDAVDHRRCLQVQ